MFVKMSRGKMLLLVLFLAVLAIAEGEKSCRWVCVNKKNNIVKEYFDSSKLSMNSRNNVIDLQQKIGRSAKNYHGNEIPEVLPRMPRLNLTPSQGKTKLDCSSKDFMRQLSKMTKKTTCIPRDTILELNYKGAQVSPTQISVKKCTGLCGTNKLCMSQESKNITVAISIFDRTTGHMCATETVQEDTRCSCQCNKSKADCLSTQVFDKKFCKCKCFSKEEQEKCLKKHKSEPHKFAWNGKTCSCQCKHPSLCSTGTQWSNVECKCIRNPKLS